MQLYSNSNVNVTVMHTCFTYIYHAWYIDTINFKLTFVLGVHVKTWSRTTMDSPAQDVKGHLRPGPLDISQEGHVRTSRYTPGCEGTLET